ncbi:MAG: carbon storage regulator [Pirellulaceae bacterium]|nr:carbon storage regulator [Pirellulaceae bacterium]
MLVLSRKLEESIVIGDEIVVKVVKIRGNVVGLGIEAPNSVKIRRSELIDRDAAKAAQSLPESPASLPIDSAASPARNVESTLSTKAILTIAS